MHLDEVNTRDPARWAGALLVGCRLLVGIVFLVAGVPKIGNHQGMMNAIDAYEVLPAGIIGPLAYLLQCTRRGRIFEWQ